MDPGLKRAALLRLIESHAGNLSAMASALHFGAAASACGVRRGISRQGLAHHLRREPGTAGGSLLDDAARARARAGVGGVRASLPHGLADAAAERAAMLQALALMPSYPAAIKALGLSRRTFYRRLRALHVTRAAIEARRREIKAENPRVFLP